MVVMLCLRARFEEESLVARRWTLGDMAGGLEVMCLEDGSFRFPVADVVSLA